MGSKKNPIWRVVVADQRSPRDGRFIETSASYNPQTDPSTIVLDEERLQHWLARGAQPTGTVKKLMKAHAKGIQPAAASHGRRRHPRAAGPAGPEAPAAGAEAEPDAVEAERGRRCPTPRRPSERPRGRRPAPEATPTPPRPRRRRGAARRRRGPARRRLAVVEDLLAYLARALVDEPDEVSVESFEEEDGTIVLELHVGEDDTGKVIGRGGRTVAALRTVVKASAVRQGRRVLVDVVD